MAESITSSKRARQIAVNRTARHKGYVFSNAWVHQTVESMCIALMVDPQGDPEIIKAQELMRATLERWIPIILAAQMPDGYLQTAYILADRKDWPERWSPDHRGNHEGYVSGLFHRVGDQSLHADRWEDLRLYNAAKKLADCWVANIGPGKKEWFDGHQEMEQALVRFGRFVNDQEGNHRGDAYIALAKFLLDSRRGGSEYDQSHLPPGQQYEAVGHAVRAMYFYSGMADIAAETQDPRLPECSHLALGQHGQQKVLPDRRHRQWRNFRRLRAELLPAQRSVLRNLFELRRGFLPIQTQSRVSRREVCRPLRADDVQRASGRCRTRR